jgi:hypothetical protein
MTTRRDFTKAAFIAPLILSYQARPAFAGAGSGEPTISGGSGSQEWKVDYSTRVDVSQASQFYGPGAYLFLKAPDNTPVYLQQGGWSFIGLYGQGAPVPAAIPAIVFTGAFDQAVATRP